MLNIGKGRAIALIKDKSYPYKVAKDEKGILCIDLEDLMPIIEGIYGNNTVQLAKDVKDRAFQKPIKSDSKMKQCHNRPEASCRSCKALNVARNEANDSVNRISEITEGIEELVARGRDILSRSEADCKVFRQFSAIKNKTNKIQRKGFDGGKFAK